MSAQETLYCELRLSVEFANRMLIQGAHRVSPLHHAGGRALISIIYGSLITEASLTTTDLRLSRFSKDEQQDVIDQLRRRTRGILAMYPIASSSDEETGKIEDRALLSLLSLLHRVIPNDVVIYVRERSALGDMAHCLPLDIVLSHYGCTLADERLRAADPEIRSEFDALFTSLWQPLRNTEMPKDGVMSALGLGVDATNEESEPDVVDEAEGENTRD